MGFSTSTRESGLETVLIIYKLCNLWFVIGDTPPSYNSSSPLGLQGTCSKQATRLPILADRPNKRKSACLPLFTSTPHDSPTIQAAVGVTIDNAPTTVQQMIRGAVFLPVS